MTDAGPGATASGARTNEVIRTSRMDCVTRTLRTGGLIRAPATPAGPGAE